MIEEQIRTAIEMASPRQFDELSESLWKLHAGGHLDDGAAQNLAELLQERRKLGRVMTVQAIAARKLPGPPRHRPYRQHSPDRAASVERRRQLAASGPLPPHLAARFTTCELAALKVIADEIMAKGYCDLTIAEIAARAGTCERTVRYATKWADRYGLISVTHRPRVGQKNLTNIIRIKSPEWLAWLSHHRQRPAQRPIGCKKIRATATDPFGGVDCRDKTGIWRPGWRRKEALSEPR
jgi:hypothetical protein